MKAWYESRGRFFASAAVLCAYYVSFMQRARFDFPPRFAPSMTYSTFVWRGVYSGPSLGVFVVVAFVLGLGGLRQERSLGTALFTLSLPVSRSRMVATRLAVAAMQTATLAVLPAVVIPWLSTTYTGHVYAVSDALGFAALSACGGLVWAAAGALSSTLPGEHAGMLAAVFAPALWAAMFRRVAVLNLFDFMSGAGLPNFDVVTSRLTGPLPWTWLLAALVAAAALGVAAGFVTTSQDF